jgi:hypothetical protein
MTDYKQFKEMYNDDPEFREKIRLHKNEKIRCPSGCGAMVSRSNMSAHKRSDACIRYCQDNVDVTTNEINKLRERIIIIEEMLNKVINDD